MQDKEDQCSILHFTPGCLDPENFRKKGTVAIMPLAASRGESEIPACTLRPEAASRCRQLLTRSCTWSSMGESPGTFDHSVRIEIWAGVGFLLEASKPCRLASPAGAVLIAIESAGITADTCGLSLPERVRGQPWPHSRATRSTASLASIEAPMALMICGSPRGYGSLQCRTLSSDSVWRRR